MPLWLELYYLPPTINFYYIIFDSNKMNSKSKITSFFTVIRSTASGASTCNSEISNELNETVNVKRPIDDDNVQNLNKEFNSQV